MPKGHGLLQQKWVWSQKILLTNIAMPPPPPLSSSSYAYDGVYIKIPFSTFEMRNQTSMRLQLFYHMDQFHLLSAIVDCHFRSLDSKQHVHPSQWATAALSFLSVHSQSEVIFN